MEITAYICNNKLRGIDTGQIPVTHDGPSAITEENGIVTVPIIKDDIDTDENLYIDAYLHSLSSTEPRFCKLSTALRWEFEKRETVYPDRSIFEITGINLIYLNPDICDWEETKVSGSFFGIMLDTQPGSGDGLCPEDKEDVLDGEGTYELNTTMLVPGEAIFLYWKFLSTPLQLIKQDYIHSELLTSGQITAINRPSEFSYDVTYSVASEGEILTGLITTDLYDYEIGDWVFILKPYDSIIPIWIGGTTGSGVGPS